MNYRWKGNRVYYNPINTCNYANIIDLSEKLILCLSPNLFPDFGYQLEKFITFKRLIRLRRIRYACEGMDV